MVRRHDHNHNHPNTKSRGSDCAHAGLSLLGIDAALRAQGAVPAVLAERKIRLYSRNICLIDARCFGQPAFTLRIFRRHQMASRRTRPQDFATGGDLEAFRH